MKIAARPAFMSAADAAGYTTADVSALIAKCRDELDDEEWPLSVDEAAEIRRLRGIVIGVVLSLPIWAGLFYVGRLLLT